MPDGVEGLHNGLCFVNIFPLGKGLLEVVFRSALAVKEAIILALR